MNRFRYAARVALYLYSFAVFGLMCVLFLPVAVPVSLLPKSWRLKCRPWVRTIVQKGFTFIRWHCRVTGFATMKVIDHRGDRRSPLMIANHLSMFDIVLLFGFMPGIQTLVNSKFAMNPLLRPTIQAAGYIPLDVKRPLDGVRAFEELEKSLGAGEEVALFPEGTRSETGQLSTLKKGPFRLAEELGIAPGYIFFTCNQPFLNRAAFFPRSGGEVVLEAHLFPPSEDLLGQDAEAWKKDFIAKYQSFQKSSLALTWNRNKDEHGA
ncbi:MAG: 1-acyl-sn-glycerol-3-phosphate acyltransferase [Oligoflexus sp.]|nr:1-acyl-sn-glycerol-3-phosphate acyltransferase [Oligoflexus sp.]